MLAKADLVVIANPISETTDTKEEAFLPGIWLQGKDGKQSKIASIGGPNLVRFDPSDTSKRSSYLLFLVREPDGRFAPIGGQMDPVMKAISPIPFEMAPVL